ncbi:hypothetical protein JOF53_000050 [Crossiella equi]|uniref:Uncharacterized protein n=1 Tax=Crossiella equi TaxID=130796 RepID=A0ABS5A3S4_9PSEU|nr:hypothetical protein [Crossiella equi]MBP2471178.1 hypothetical protein [Crossiella equi]
MPITLSVVRDAREYIPAAHWDRLAILISRDHDVDRALAERILAQTVAFLITCARNPGLPLGPAPMVDKGWHTFLTDTVPYRAFCQAHNGDYINHIPHLPGEDQEGPLVLRTTIQAIRDAGFTLDEQLWNAEGVDCNQCYAGCSNSPGKGK